MQGIWVRSLVRELRFHMSQRQLSLGTTTTEPVRSGVSLPQLERSLYATTKIPRAAASTRHSQGKKEKGGKEKWPPQSISPILDAVVRSLQSCPTLVTSWTVALQAPLSRGFPRQEYWTGLPFPSPGDLPDPRVKPGSPILQVDSLLWATKEAEVIHQSQMETSSWTSRFSLPGKEAGESLLPWAFILTLEKSVSSAEAPTELFPCPKQGLLRQPLSLNSRISIATWVPAGGPETQQGPAYQPWGKAESRW